MLRKVMKNQVIDLGSVQCTVSKIGQGFSVVLATKTGPYPVRTNTKLTLTDNSVKVQKVIEFFSDEDLGTDYQISRLDIVGPATNGRIIDIDAQDLINSFMYSNRLGSEIKAARQEFKDRSNAEFTEKCIRQLQKLVDSGKAGVEDINRLNAYRESERVAAEAKAELEKHIRELIHSYTVDGKMLTNNQFKELYNNNVELEGLIRSKWSNGFPLNTGEFEAIKNWISIKKAELNNLIKIYNSKISYLTDRINSAPEILVGNKLVVITGLNCRPIDNIKYKDKGLLETSKIKAVDTDGIEYSFQQLTNLDSPAGQSIITLFNLEKLKYERVINTLMYKIVDVKEGNINPIEISDISYELYDGKSLRVVDENGNKYLLTELFNQEQLMEYLFTHRNQFKAEKAKVETPEETLINSIVNGKSIEEESEEDSSEDSVSEDSYDYESEEDYTNNDYYVESDDDYEEEDYGYDDDYASVEKIYKNKRNNN